MQAAISDPSSAPVNMMDCLLSGCSAMLTDGYEHKQAREWVQGLQDGPTQVTGKRRKNKFSCCFYGFHFLASACLICSPLWGWIAMKDCSKKVFEYPEGRIFKIQLLSELLDRGWNDWREKSMDEFLLLSSMQNPFE